MGDVLVAELAESAIDLVTGPRIRSVRACAHPGCVLLILPTHQGRSWCSPARCGNRARVVRYETRHKSREMIYRPIHEHRTMQGRSEAVARQPSDDDGLLRFCLQAADTE